MAKNRGNARRNEWLLACGAVVFCFGLTLVGAPALAAPADEQVTVQDDAPYTVHRQMLDGPFGSTSSMMREEKTSVSKGVAYSDLDLSRDSDVILLKARAKAAAVEVCREATRRAGSPLYLADERAPGCVADAKKQAMANVNRIVADARAGRTLARN